MKAYPLNRLKLFSSSRRAEAFSYASFISAINFFHFFVFSFVGGSFLLIVFSIRGLPYGEPLFSISTKNSINSYMKMKANNR